MNSLFTNSVKADSPFFLSTPGEAAAGPYGAYLTNATINGEYAQKMGAAVLMVERMYNV